MVSRTELGDHFEFVALLKDTPPLEEEGKTWETRNYHAVIPRRVAPREFIGVLIPDENVNKLGKRLGRTASKEFAKEEAQWIGVNFMSEDYSLPIYGTSGDLLWPKQILQSELAKSKAELPKAA